jgi:hypothetical protein
MDKPNINPDKYAAIYRALMSTAQSRGKPAGYVEQHHIEPRSVGGPNTKDNLVWLTAREHLVAHKLWARMEQDPKRKRKAQSALWAMTVMRSGDTAGRIIPSSRDYEMAKRALVQSKLNVVRTQETKDKISVSLTKHFADNGCHNKGRSFDHLSAAERSSIFGVGNRGRVQPAEERERRAAKLRKPRSPEACENIRLGQLAYQAKKRQQKEAQCQV